MLFSYASVSLELSGPSAKASPGISSLLADQFFLRGLYFGIREARSASRVSFAVFIMNAVFSTDLAFILAFHQNPPADVFPRSSGAYTPEIIPGHVDNFRRFADSYEAGSRISAG